MDEHEKAGADRAVDLLSQIKQLQVENTNLKNYKKEYDEHCVLMAKLGQESTKRISELIADNEHLVSVVEATRQDNADYLNGTLEEKLVAERDRLREGLEKIRCWQQAYPLAVFPEPDLKKAHKVLKAAGMTLDTISAGAMRHVINGVKDIVDVALKENVDGK